jgi:RNA polymerase sigma factor (sigma-70 family)
MELNESLSGPGESALLAMFMQDLKQFPILTRAEESALIARAAAGDKAAEDRLVASSLRFVVKVALSHWRALSYRYPGLSPMDLIQEASIGLVRAVRKLNPAFGYRLLTYAGPAIRHGIARVIVDYKRHQCDSLDDAISGYDDETLLDRLPSEDDSADAATYQTQILDLLKSLKTREKVIVEEHFLKDRTLGEIAGMLRVGAERVRQIETKALFRLRWAVEHGEPFFAERQGEQE